MSRFFRTIWRGLFTNGARTDESASEEWLRGRTYAIPFDRVWNAALELAQGGLKGWQVQFSDDHEGIIRAEVAAARLRPALLVTLRIGLGVDAETYVEAEAHAPDRRVDLGRSNRQLGKFFDSLDRSLAGTPVPAGV